jgi:hypothetical protein
MEDDGKATAEEPVKVIDECQLADLDALIDDVQANRAGFLKAYKIEFLEMLPASMLKHACESLNAKRKS